MERTDYRFTLTRDTDTFEVFPEDFYDGNFKYTQDEGQMFFRKEYDGALCFKKTDYAYIKDRYDDGYYCDIYELLIEKKISGVYETDWTGYFSMTDGKFDFERCRYYVTPTVDDKYSCVLRNWEKEVNIVDGNFTYLNSKIKSQLEIEIRGHYGAGAVPFYQLMYAVLDHQYMGGGNYYISISCREAIILPDYITPNPLDGWIVWDENDTSSQVAVILNRITPTGESKKWVRSGSYVSWKPTASDINVYDILSNPRPSLSTYRQIGTYSTFDNYVYAELYILKSVYNNEVWPMNITYKGYSLLTSILNVLKETCDEFSESTITAPMFTSATSPATGEANELLNVYLIQKSDAKRPNDSNNATIGKTTFKELMEILYSAFQILWDISDNYNLILKHQSEIENNQGLNISVAPYTAMTAHYKGIEFNKNLLFRYEKWEFMEAKNEDFIGLPIEYNEFCTIKENDAKTKTYSLGSITTDLSLIQQEESEISDDGFCMVALLSSEIAVRNGLITGYKQLNEALSLARLHDNYWRHNRILSTGLMNGASITFESSQKIRKLPELTIKYCGEFDPKEEITTELGNGIVNEATFKPFDQTLTLNLSI